MIGQTMDLVNLHIQVKIEFSILTLEPSKARLMLSFGVVYIYIEIIQQYWILIGDYLVDLVPMMLL
jgi:hypothetical protein